MKIILFGKVYFLFVSEDKLRELIDKQLAEYTHKTIIDALVDAFKKAAYKVTVLN